VARWFNVVIKIRITFVMCNNERIKIAPVVSSFFCALQPSMTTVVFLEVMSNKKKVGVLSNSICL
jgi:hypothetical protein